MRKNNLLQLLESFDPVELNRFQEFISSKYFNKDTRLILLFTLLKKKVLHKKPLDESTQTAIYQSLFADIDPLEGVINASQKKLLGVRMSLLGKLATHFLRVEELQNDPSSQIRLLNKRMLDKNQYHIIAQSNKNRLTSLGKVKTRDLEYYHRTLQLQEGILTYCGKKSIYSKEDNFQEMNQYLDLYYLIWKLRLHITMKSVALNNPKKQYDFTIFHHLMLLLKTTNYTNNPLITLYLTTLDLMYTNDKSTYQHLLQQLDQYEDSISKTDLIGFYTVASNFCSQQSRKQNPLQYLQESLAFYKVMEEKKLLMEGSFLQVNKLTNLVNLSCKAGDFVWATKMVHKYYLFIVKEQQKNIKHLLLGIICFYQEQYEEVLNHLNQVEDIHMPYALHYRTLRLKSSYELDDHYSIYTHQVFISTQSFIRNQKTPSKERRKSYENFIQLLMNLYKVKHQEGRMTLTKVKDKMGKMDLISNKEWLLEKIEQLQQ